MRVLVTGSRDWEDRFVVARALNEVCDEFDLNFEPDEYGNTMPDDRKITVVHGDCPTGADFFATDWCLGNFFVPETHPADWKEHGRAAGPIRNREMIESGIDLVLAFNRNKSKGTTGTIRMAEEAGIEVRVFEETS